MIRRSFVPRTAAAHNRAIGTGMRVPKSVRHDTNGKSAILIHRRYLGRERNPSGFHLWGRGYCVSTVGLDE